MFPADAATLPFGTQLHEVCPFACKTMTEAKRQNIFVLSLLTEQL